MKTEKVNIPEPDQSWLHREYKQGEINTKLPYVSLYDYFWQGEEAEKVIKEIHEIWLKGDLTQQEAVNKWCGYYL